MRRLALLLNAVLWALYASAAGAKSIPDYSKNYFKGLQRPAAAATTLSREGGPVILIIVDALRPDRMSTYGFERPTTPNLSRLADEGIILTNYFVNGNWTRPSTATMMTGLPPASHGVERDQDSLSKEVPTLAEELSSHGIVTGAVVGNGNAGSAFGLGRGFDEYHDTTKHWDGLPDASQVIDLSVPFVKKHKDRPFFLMMFLVDPHDPYHAPGAYEDMFVADKKAPLVRSPHWELGRYSKPELERMKATYDGAVRYTDDQIGRFFERLKVMGVYDKATIIVTSDHGEAFGEHGVFLHAHHLYDELIRVPFLLKTPKLSERGKYSQYLFESRDLMPTVLGHFGIEAKRKLDGVDIFAHLRKPSLNDPRRAVISEFFNFGISRRSVRSYHHKVIYQDPADEVAFRASVGKPAFLPSVSFDRHVVQVFDLKHDAFETKNLYSSEGMKNSAWRPLLTVAQKHRRVVKAPKKRAYVQNLDEETLKDLKALGYIEE